MTTKRMTLLAVVALALTLNGAAQADVFNMGPDLTGYRIEKVLF